MNLIQIDQSSLLSKLSIFLEDEISITQLTQQTANVFKAFCIDHGRDNKSSYLKITLSQNIDNEVILSVEMDINGLRDIGCFIYN